MEINLLHGDCLERMKEIPAGSVDLILTDLPYGTMKGANLDGWKGLATDWDVVIDTDNIMEAANRLLRKNGKMVLFGNQPFTTELISKALPNLPHNYNMYWDKCHFANCLVAKKAPVSYVEDIMVFSKMHQKHDFEGLHPLREYFKSLINFAGITKKELISKIGQKADHCFRVNSAQFSLCTEATYSELISIFGIDKMEGFKLFPELEKINSEYRDDLLKQMTEQHPSTFNLWQGNKYKSNILKYKKDCTGHHPTQKPIALLEDLIKTFSNEGDLILDMTMGSGSTMVACQNTGRSGIGIELDADYFAIAERRINEARQDLR